MPLAPRTDSESSQGRMTLTASQPKTLIRPLRIYSRNEQLGVNTRHVYGYRAECSCDWRGHLWDEYGDASKEARWHRGTHDERGI
jgi:hypothetical protein